MTNEFAIKVLTELRGYGDKFANIGFDRKEALDMAIKALGQQPCEDCIDRAEVLMHSHIEYDDDGVGHRVIYSEDIEELPSVTPKQKVGKWIDSNLPQEKYVCSECGGACWYYDYEDSVAKSKYCPNCGSYNWGGEE